MSFPARLRQAREAAGLSTEQLSAKTRIHAVQISRYENGHEMPKIPNLLTIAKSLRVSTDWLLGLRR